MDLSFSPEEIAFQQEVRDFLASHLPEHISDAVRSGVELPREIYQEWHEILGRKGWLCTSWPKRSSTGSRGSRVKTESSPTSQLQSALRSNAL